ncbi:putative F-box/LRR-repeat protein [Cardamine amara subsp. amara]|uniref:F-box/LRR-repeat protein n=1 Tax=Cardamine amara subsp. amara TaxID=228776 RepID=A0ABD1AEW7_CARAN
MPDVILETILSSLPTKFAISTSILSKRWRNLWCETPCLNLEWCGNKLRADSINETQARYTARKMMSFHFCLSKMMSLHFCLSKMMSLHFCLSRVYTKSPYIESWIEFAKSQNVENMTMDLGSIHKSYTMPDSFYINSSVKQLTLYLTFADTMIPSSSVSWTSLKELFLRQCNLSERIYST